MIFCAYKTENSQCACKSVFTPKQIVNDSICGQCQFQARQIDPNKLRNQLPILEEHMIKDETKEPGVLQIGANFIGAAAKHIMNGAENVTKEVYEKRMAICNSCEHRNGTACKICGCNLPRKLKWASNQCPLYPQDPTKWGPEK